MDTGGARSLLHGRDLQAAPQTPPLDSRLHERHPDHPTTAPIRPRLIGYSLRAELTNKTFWTFSAWENQDRLDEFAGSSPHSQIIQGLRPKTDKPIVKFVDGVDGSQLPWGWAEVKRQLQENLG
jgi:hypothetical protein